MRLFLFLFAFAIPIDGYAVSFLSFDASSMATGGAGSVTGISGPQPFLSPATFRRSEYCCALRIYAGARVIDRQHFLATANNVRNWYEELNLEEQLVEAENGFNPNHLQSHALRRLHATADELVAALNSLPDKPLRMGASAGAYVHGQNDQLAVSAFNRRYLVVGAVIRNHPQDMQSIASLQSALNIAADLIDNINHMSGLIEALDQRAIEELALGSIESGTVDPRLYEYQEIPGVVPLIQGIDRLERDVERLEDHVNLRQLITDAVPKHTHTGRALPSFNDVDVRDYLHHPLPDKINSTILFSGAEVEEAGVNISFALPEAPQLTLGVNLKEMRFSTIDFVQRVDQFEISHYQSESTRREYRFWNLDLGVNYQLAQHWTAGAVLKNLRRKQMRTVRGNSIELKPIARVGMAYQYSQLLFTVDADLTKNDPLVVRSGNSVTKEHSQSVRIKARKRRNNGVLSSFLNTEPGALATRTVT